MARKLNFSLDDRRFEFVIHKLDRNKLYGSQEVKVIGLGEEELRKGYLDEWGSVVISATGMGYVDKDKIWRPRAELAAVDTMGNKLELKPSSFDNPIPLRETVSVEEYCAYESVSVYILEGFELEEFAGLLSRTEGLYRFPFVYRASYEAKTAFLNPVSDKVFMIIGIRAELEYLKKPQRTEIEDFEEEEEIDFSMM